MAADPLVTVLTAVRNGARYIRHAVESIRRQSCDDWEHLIVDDASDDETPEIVASYMEADPRIRLLRHDVSAGPYAAANTGLASARGRYVVRLDADDVAPPERLASQIAFFEAREGLEAVVGSWRWMDDDGSLGGVAGVHTRSPRVLRWSICVLPGIVHSTACILRSSLEELGGYPEYPTSADLWLWCTLARRGTLGVSSNVLVHYRRHGGQITSRRAESQRDFGSLVVHGHLEALTGERWAVQEASALYGTGRWLDVPFEAGLSALDRWQRLWSSDPELTAADRFELRRISARVRLRHMRVNAGGMGQRLRSVASLVRAL